MSYYLSHPDIKNSYMKVHESGFKYTHTKVSITEEGKWQYWFKNKSIVAIYRFNEMDGMYDPESKIKKEY